jgi:predicted DNA-binding transcriptional regulator YafY
MRRADRLFELLLWLRRKRAVTAAELARRLEVSERTIYRDISDLMASGVPSTAKQALATVSTPVSNSRR